MKISEAYPSKYLRTTDLAGKPCVLTITGCDMQTYGDGTTAPVIGFRGTEKMLGLNKTNAGTIAALYGDETEDWVGKPIEVFPTETDYQGKRMPCIRVRRPQSAPAMVPASQPAQGGYAPLPTDEPPFDPSGDDIPF